MGEGKYSRSILERKEMRGEGRGLKNCGHGITEGFFCPAFQTELQAFGLIIFWTSVSVCRMGLLMLGDKETQMRVLKSSCRIAAEEGDVPMG